MHFVHLPAGALVRKNPIPCTLQPGESDYLLLDLRMLATELKQAGHYPVARPVFEVVDATDRSYTRRLKIDTREWAAA